MSSVLASVLTIEDGEITLNAELLAPKTGLTANTDHPSLFDLGRTTL